MSDAVDLDIIIFYEHVGREFGTVQGLLDKFKEHNIRVRAYSYLYEYYKCLSECGGTSPTHLIVPYVYNKNSLSRYRHLLDKYPGLQIVNMHHEQIVAPFNIAKAVPLHSIAIDNVLHVSWGKKYTDMLLNAGAPSENIIQICSPRIPKKLDSAQRDILRERFAAEFDLDLNKEWVLFCEDRDWIVKDKVKMFKVLRKFGAHKTEVEEFFCHRAESLMLFCAEVNSLADNFFDRYELIYRSHPGVKGKVNLTDKVKMISSYSVYDWFQCVSFNIVDGSTSCFESDALNVKTATHQPVDGPLKFRVFGIDQYAKLAHMADLLRKDVIVSLSSQSEKMIYQDYLGDKDLDFSDIFVNRIINCKGPISFERDLYGKRWYFLRKWVFEKFVTRLPLTYFSRLTNYFGYSWLSKDRPGEV